MFIVYHEHKRITERFYRESRLGVAECRGRINTKNTLEIIFFQMSRSFSGTCYPGDQISVAASIKIGWREFRELFLVLVIKGLFLRLYEVCVIERERWKAFVNNGGK